MLDAVVAAGVDGAVELIGPGRVQFAVHAPPIEAEVDPQRLAQALAHLVADVAGVDATGNAPVSAGGYMDNTVVVAAAQRGEVVRIEVRGPYAGETRSTSRSSAASCARTAVCCRRTRCRG